MQELRVLNHILFKRGGKNWGGILIPCTKGSNVESDPGDRYLLQYFHNIFRLVKFLTLDLEILHTHFQSLFNDSMLRNLSIWRCYINLKYTRLSIWPDWSHLTHLWLTTLSTKFNSWRSLFCTAMALLFHSSLQVNLCFRFLLPLFLLFFFLFFSRKHEGFLTSTGKANESNFTNGVSFKSIN
jgi:hypothetical protein